MQKRNDLARALFCAANDFRLCWARSWVEHIWAAADEYAREINYFVVRFSVFVSIAQTTNTRTNSPNVFESEANEIAICDDDNDDDDDDEQWNCFQIKENPIAIRFDCIVVVAGWNILSRTENESFVGRFVRIARVRTLACSLAQTHFENVIEIMSVNCFEQQAMRCCCDWMERYAIHFSVCFVNLSDRFRRVCECERGAFQFWRMFICSRAHSFSWN